MAGVPGCIWYEPHEFVVYLFALRDGGVDRCFHTTLSSGCVRVSCGYELCDACHGLFDAVCEMFGK